MFSMRWSHILLIFRREVRDQLRDRRTLFMIFVLPILLYPILGFSVAQLSVAFEKEPRNIIVLGAENLPAVPPLLSPEQNGIRTIDESLFSSPENARLYRLFPKPPTSPWASPDQRRRLLRAGEADAVLIIPPGFRSRLSQESHAASLDIVADNATEKSHDAAQVLVEVLDRWNQQIVENRLARDGKPKQYIRAVVARLVNVATSQETGGSIWARLFPFLLVMMSLTGAFYPAVDLCAGEKERGTMETLLISPATRAEIVTGKFLTVMLASMSTALLNLASMAVTGIQLAHMLQPAGSGSMDGAEAAIQPPSFESAFWMVLLLLPLSAFFSAVCVALAVLARSMKEGQYYMTPLYMVALPLIFVTLAPGIDLDLFTSLVPITGVSLLLRALMLGNYIEARRFFLPVLVPIMVYGALALRWAVDQFRREAVLFREAERFELSSWFRHLIRDREPTPTSGMALFTFAAMLALAWFSSTRMTATSVGMVLGQVAFILAPPVAMTLLLTSSPKQTLRLKLPAPRYVCVSVGLALAINPLAAELRRAVEYLFPMPELIKDQLNRLVATIPNVGTALLVLAVVPAVCEEVAFRGFILSGLRRDYRTGSAIVLSAFLFGFMHVLISLFQQLFNATLLGLVLGLLAIRSRSLLPGILFHMINNGLAVLLGSLSTTETGDRLSRILFRDPSQGLYHGHWVGLGVLISAVLLVWLVRDDEHGKARPPDVLATT